MQLKNGVVQNNIDELQSGINIRELQIRKMRHPEASSTMPVLVGAHHTDARLYTFGVKIGTRTTSAREHSRC